MLLYLSRLNIQYSPPLSINCFSPSLLYQIAHRCAFIQQPQIPILCIFIVRISIDTPDKQHSMNLANQTSYVSARIRLPIRTRFSQVIQVLLQFVIEQIIVTFVEGVDCS